VRVRVRVPATSANLGPGFDSFGLALDLCNDVTADTEGAPGVSWEGEGEDELSTDGTDMVSRAIALAAERHPGPRPLPSFALHGVNLIPLERGLGSSSAAAVAGAAIARALTAGIRGPVASNPELAGMLLDVASELEGHPDNAAPAVLGGFTIVAGGEARRFEPHPSLEPIVLVPDARLATSEARRALPTSVTRDDAVFNVGHAGLAAIAFTQRPDLLGEALRDRLHEDARAALLPEAAAMLARLRGDGIHACLSGAGPSVLAFEGDGARVPDPPPPWRALRPGVRTTGVEIDVEG
jgi:homoserine kinase